MDYIGHIMFQETFRHSHGDSNHSLSTGFACPILDPISHCSTMPVLRKRKERKDTLSFNYTIRCNLYLLLFFLLHSNDFNQVTSIHNLETCGPPSLCPFFRKKLSQWTLIHQTLRQPQCAPSDDDSLVASTFPFGADLGVEIDLNGLLASAKIAGPSHLQRLGEINGSP